MKRLSILSIVLLCPILIMACITVNIYFPAGAIQQAADEIVDEVRQEQQEQKESSLNQLPLRWLARLAPLIGPRIAYAEIDIEISTPSIRVLRASLTERFKSLEKFYRIGALGENNRGFVEIRNESSLSVKEKADLRRLLDAENRNRTELYQEILQANNLEPRFLDEVGRLFANSWRQVRVVPGTWIQQDDSTWIQK